MSTPEPALSATGEDYVKVVWNASEWTGEPITVTQLAERMGVSKPTVSQQVRRLCDRGLLAQPPYGAVELTPAGRAHALAMVRRHRLIETYLVTELGYTWDEVHDEAEVLEHACSDRMIDAIDRKLGHPRRDPHGDPIPQPDGTVPTPPAVALSAAAPGEYVVARISDSDPDLLRRVSAAGIALDTPVVVAGPAEGSGRKVHWPAATASPELAADEHAAVWVSPAAQVADPAP